MTLQVRSYEFTDEAAWESLCETALQATFLHKRAFLSYHGDRFSDRSLLIEQEGNTLGLFPAAQHPRDDACIVSHPGITYGGVLHDGRLTGSRMIEALERILDHYANLGYRKLVYKVVPSIYHHSPAQDDLYALFRLGAVRVRCDLSSSIELCARLPVSSRRRRGLNKARKAGIRVESGVQFIADFWKVVVENLESKHQSSPVHSLAEIELLCRRFPQNIDCVCALHNDQVVAGVLLFKTSTVTHAQYIASSSIGYASSALDAVFDVCIAESQGADMRWFDFGISNEQGGRYLNDGLYGYKKGFGSGGVVHEFYELEM